MDVEGTDGEGWLCEVTLGPDLMECRVLLRELPTAASGASCCDVG